MTSWFALSLLIFLSVNAVLSQNTYLDPLIDEDEYLRRCFVSTGTGDLKDDGVKKIHSGFECYAKTIIQFKVEDIGTDFYVYNEQGENHVLPAKIRYKFGECYDLKLEIKKNDNDEIVYTLQNPDDGSSIDLDGGVVFRIKRRGYGEFGKPDSMQVLKKDYTKYISKECNAFEQDIDDIKAPTLIDFEQEILEGVPNFTLIWNAPLGVNKKYFGTAYAKEIKEVGTTTTTTTTAKPTTSISTVAPTTVTSTTTETSTIAPTTVNSNSSLSITDAPKTDEMSKWWFISVIIIEFVIILLLILALIASCLIIRRLAREIALFDVEVKNESAVKKS